MRNHFMDTEKDFGDVLRERATGLKEPEDPTKQLRRKLFGHGWYRDEEKREPEQPRAPDKPSGEEPNPA